MPNMPPAPVDYLAWLLKVSAELVWVLIAVVGGIARYLDAYIRSGAPPQFGPLLAHAAVSGFSGYMVAQTVLHFSADWALVAAGIGGYMGTQGLDWVASILRLRFGGDVIPPQSNNNPTSGENK